MDERKLEKQPEPLFLVHDAEVEHLQSALTRVLRSVAAHSETDGGSLWDLPVQHVRGLRRIAEKSGQSLSDVAGAMKVSLPTASRIVEKLVTQGLVERRADPHDRRALRLEATEKARALLAELQASRQKHLAACAGRLDVEDRKTVLDGLRLLAAASEQVDFEGL